MTSRLAIAAALLLSGVSLYCDTLGLAALFPGAALVAMVLAVALGLGKIAAALWLKSHWHAAPALIRWPLVAAVAVLCLISVATASGFLVRAHQPQATHSALASIAADAAAQQIAIEQTRHHPRPDVLAQLAARQAQARADITAAHADLSPLLYAAQLGTAADAPARADAAFRALVLAVATMQELLAIVLWVAGAAGLSSRRTRAAPIIAANPAPLAPDTSAIATDAPAKADLTAVDTAALALATRLISEPMRRALALSADGRTVPADTHHQVAKALTRAGLMASDHTLTGDGRAIHHHLAQKDAHHD